MGSSSLSEDYRLCLERELRRGRAGVCGDPSLRAVLWQILVEDFDLHGALQDDALALLTDGLWGRADLAPALRGLARAFELLELAAVHLYLLPWRKEFTTIKTFSGGYVHVLRGALSEDLLIQSFRKMGYVRRDAHRLMGAWGPVEASSPPYEASEEELESEPEAFSFLSLRRELLSQPGDLAAPQAPGSPERASPPRVHGPVPEPLGYQAHSCLAPGALPTLCCDTCRQLHAAHCPALPACRPGHVLHVLRGNSQRRLWLQRAQVDALLYEGPGAQP